VGVRRAVNGKRGRSEEKEKVVEAYTLLIRISLYIVLLQSKDFSTDSIDKKPPLCKSNYLEFNEVHLLMAENSSIRKKCFVIMPFSQTTEMHDRAYWTGFFNHFIKHTVEALGYACYRSSAKPRQIISGIVEDLSTANIVLAVLTDNNPNVWYELGIRHSLRHGTIMIIERGQKIPFDVASYGAIYYDRTKRGKFQDELNQFVISIENKDSYDNPILDHSSKSSVQLAMTSSSVLNSPLTFEKVLDKVVDTTLIVGQNLNSLVTDERHKEVLFRTLREKAINVHLLLWDPDDEHGVKTIKECIAELFDEHLLQTIDGFKKWNEELEKEGPQIKGKLRVKTTKKIGSISLTFLDPRNNHGELLITPVTWQAQATTRPCFWISKLANRSSFETYWSNYETIWRNHSKSIFEEGRNRSGIHLGAIN
jgi:hypothetical protein